MGPTARTARTGRGLLALLAAVAVTGCAQDLHTASWPDLVTARQQDALDRGWVPEWLPEAASDVRQANRPATGAAVVRAGLPDDEPVDECDVTEEVGVRPDLVDWWQPADGGLRLLCDGDWWAVRADDTIWAWQVGSPADPPTDDPPPDDSQPDEPSQEST